MALFNTKNSFGIINKLLHWIIAALMISQFVMIYLRWLLPKSYLKSYLILLHKQNGFLVLPLALLFIVLRLYFGRPKTLTKNILSKFIAKLSHFLLYVSICVMSVSGILTSWFYGRSINVFGYKIIPLVSKNKYYANICYDSHQYFSYLTLLLIILHISAALKHAFWDKDQTLARMLVKIS